MDPGDLDPVEAFESEELENAAQACSVAEQFGEADDAECNNVEDEALEGQEPEEDAVYSDESLEGQEPEEDAVYSDESLEGQWPEENVSYDSEDDWL